MKIMMTTTTTTTTTTIKINNNTNNIPETRKYWVDVQWGIVLSHGERNPL